MQRNIALFSAYLMQDFVLKVKFEGPLLKSDLKKIISGLSEFGSFFFSQNSYHSIGINLLRVRMKIKNHNDSHNFLRNFKYVSHVFIVSSFQLFLYFFAFFFSLSLSLYSLIFDGFGDTRSSCHWSWKKLHRSRANVTCYYISGGSPLAALHRIKYKGDRPVFRAPRYYCEAAMTHYRVGLIKTKKRRENQGFFHL